MKKITAIILAVALIDLSCTTLNTKNSYNLSSASLVSGDINSAIKSLPDGEGDTFISLMERTYLNLLTGNPEIDKLASYAYKIDMQVRYKISRESKSFFFIETPEGYYASEHEIIWMHFLLSWGYSLRQESEKAHVEVKKASVLLSNRFTGEGRFDDAFMRVICGVLWAMCGEWDEAGTDFRRALQLNPSMKWIKTLIAMEDPPANLTLILGGIGYQPYWNPKNDKFVRGYRDVDFQPVGKKSRLMLSLPDDSSMNLFMTPDASGWYKRHKIRNNEIADVIDDVKYTEKFTFSSARMASHVLYGVAGGLLIFTVIGGIGAGLIALGLYINSGELAGLGAGAVVYGGYKGIDFAHSNYKDAVSVYKKEMNPSDRYRFVRFLPEYSWLGWSKQELDTPLIIKTGNLEIILHSSRKIPSKKPQVIIGYYPDIK
jgi:hypothetical protein